MEDRETEDPLVQVTTNIYNGMDKDLPRFLQAIAGLDYPKNRIRIAATVSPSEDYSLQALLEWLIETGYEDWNVRYINAPDSPVKRFRTWTCGNWSRALMRAQFKGKEDADYMFICDSDVVEIPSQTIHELISLDVDIVAPYTYVDPTHLPENYFRGRRYFFDEWGFRFLKGPYPGYHFNHTLADLYARNMERDPSIGADLEKRLIPMQSVGACPVLIKGEVIRNVWYEGDQAIVGFCKEARKAGYKVWAYPDIECLHTWRGRHGSET